MALQERLDALRAMSKTRIPPEAQAVMQRSIDDLRASGMMRRIARAGQRAPAFTLPNASGVGSSVSRGVRATWGEMTARVAPAAVISGRTCCRASSSALQYGHQRPR